MHSTEPWSVFCAHDEVHEVRADQSNPESVGRTDRLGDFNWIDAGNVRNAKKQLEKLPYQGPRWYSREVTTYLLHRQVVRLTDTKRYITATAHLPPDFFKGPLDALEETIDPELAKKAVNSLLGVWSVDRHYTYVVATQYNSSSFPFDGKVMVRDATGLRDSCY